MSRYDHRHSARGKSRDPLPKFSAGKGIGSAGRLIEEKNLGPVKEGSRHRQALFVSPLQLRARQEDKGFEFELGYGPRDPLALTFSVQAVGAREKI